MRDCWIIMEEQIKGIIADVFQVDAGTITADFGPGTVSQWDSAGHMRLIMALEEALDVTFDDDGVGDLVTLGAIVEAVQALKQ